MKKVLLLVLAIAMLTLCAISCEFSNPDDSTGSDNSTSSSESISAIDSTESDESPAVCEHEFADNYTCHDRVCKKCGETVKATTEHKLADNYTCHDRECSDCGETVKATTEHKLADNYTCHDRECTDCGETVKATTEHVFGEWTVVTKATCLTNGEDKRACECGETETKTTTGTHEFKTDGICNYCNQNIKNLFMTADGATSVVKINAKQGRYEISSTAANYDAYAVISGDILEALKELGYKTLTFTVINPGVVCEDDWKTFKMAADDKNNLWSADTAIAFIAATQIFDGGKKYTFTFNVETYAGKDVYIYVDKCKNYPTVVEISEFFDYEAPEARLSASDNSAVEYIDGKGWHIYATDTTKNDYYATIPGEVLKHYIDNGYTSLKVSFVNTFGLEGITTAGNSVNCQMQFLPKRASDGGEQWGYLSNFISQFAQAEDGSYFATINLSDSTYDFAKGMRMYIKMTDVANATVGHTYINGIEFTK